MVTVRLYQKFTLISTLTGFIVKLKIFDTPTREQLFDDHDFWEVSPQSKAKFAILGYFCGKRHKNRRGEKMWNI